MQKRKKFVTESLVSTDISVHAATAAQQASLFFKTNSFRIFSKNSYGKRSNYEQDDLPGLENDEELVH